MKENARKEKTGNKAVSVKAKIRSYRNRNHDRNPEKGILPWLFYFGGFRREVRLSRNF